MAPEVQTFPRPPPICGVLGRWEQSWEFSYRRPFSHVQIDLGNRGSYLFFPIVNYGYHFYTADDYYYCYCYYDAN